MEKFEIEYKEEMYEFVNGELYHRSSFEPEWIQRLIGREPKVIFEFGSADGGDALRFKKYYPKSEIYSFEPDPKLYKIAQKIKNYNINIYNYAISDKEGEINFYRVRFKNSENYMEAGSLLEATEERKQSTDHLSYDNQPIKVYCTTIELFCKENNISEIDFMQIDVEGAADKVINGFGNIRPKILFIELQSTSNSHKNSATTESVMKKLIELGYEFLGTNNVDSLFILKESRVK